MLHRPVFFWMVMCFILLSTSCRPDRPETSGRGTNLIRHAALLQLEETPRYTLATVRNPWDTAAVLARYVLVPATRQLPDSLPEGTLLRTPLRHVAAQSSVHAALAQRLGCAALLSGVCDRAYIVDTALLALTLPDLGSGMRPDVERLVAGRTEAFLVAPFQNSGHGSLAASGIPLVECADYMETSPLGRAEWMRFFGRLFGVAARADSLFAAEVEAYERLSGQVASAVPDTLSRPTLLIDRQEGAAWYVPGGHSYLARLFRDAGARYVFARLDGSGGVPLDPETVLRAGADAEVWVIKYGAPRPLTYAALAADRPLYRRFRAFTTRRVYGCNTLLRPYYEQMPFAPARLLAEWVSLLHPALAPRSGGVPFFQPLEE